MANTSIKCIGCKESGETCSENLPMPLHFKNCDKAVNQAVGSFHYVTPTTQQATVYSLTVGFLSVRHERWKQQIVKKKLKAKNCVRYDAKTCNSTASCKIYFLRQIEQYEQSYYKGIRTRQTPIELNEAVDKRHSGSTINNFSCLIYEVDFSFPEVVLLK